MAVSQVLLSEFRSFRREVIHTKYKIHLIAASLLALGLVCAQFAVFSPVVQAQGGIYPYPVHILALSPDGALLAVAGRTVATDSEVFPEEYPIDVLDSETGELVAENSNLYPIADLCWSSDSTQILSSDVLGGVEVWGISDQRQVAVAGIGAVAIDSVECSPSGNRFAFPLARDVYVGSFPQGSTDAVLRDSEQPAESYFMAWNPDGDYLASTAGGRILIWDAQTGTLLHRLERPSGPLAWSPDGQWIGYYLGHGQIRIFDVDTQEDVITLSSPPSNDTPYVDDIVFSPDSGRMAASITIRRVPAIYIWDVVTGEIIETISVPTYATDLAWSPDGTRLYHNGGTDGIGIFVNGSPL